MERIVRIWLDATDRPMPSFYTIKISTVEEMINLIVAGGVEQVSLGGCLRTVRNGVDAAKYIEHHAFDGGYRFGVQIHEKSDPLRSNMVDYIKKALRYWIKQEKCDIVNVDSSTESWFVIMALCLQKKKDGQPLPEVVDGAFKVQLTVNGVDVSFVDAVGEMYTRMLADVDRKAANIAAEKMTGRFDELANTLVNANNLVRNSVFDTFGVDVKKLC